MNGDLSYFRVYAAELLADQHSGYYDIDELGSWFRLVCQCWVDGSIPSDPTAVARLLRMPPGERFGRIWEAIKDRFVPTDEPGRLTSRRLEEERALAIDARDEKSRTARAAGLASGKARREQLTNKRSTTAQQKPNARSTAVSNERTPSSQPSIHPPHPSAPASQPASAVRKANGSELPGAPPPLDVGRLAGWKRKLGEALHLPGGIIAVGKQGQESEVLLFFQTQLERVGEENLLADCLDCANRSKTGTPSSLAWFVPWLRNLSLPPQATEEA